MLVTKIKVDGKEYPCRQSMGALLRYKRETGKDFDGKDMESLMTYIWCCVASACQYEKQEFKYSLTEFADALDPQDFTEWCTSEQKNTSKKEEGGEKKSL